jgi:hypothetical protein
MTNDFLVVPSINKNKHPKEHCTQLSLHGQLSNFHEPTYYEKIQSKNRIKFNIQ